MKLQIAILCHYSLAAKVRNSYISICLCSCKVTIHSCVTMRNKHRNISCSPADIYWCISIFTFQQVSTADIHRENYFKEEFDLIISSWILTEVEHFHSYSCILQYMESQHGSWGSVITPKRQITILRSQSRPRNESHVLNFLIYLHKKGDKFMYIT